MSENLDSNRFTKGQPQLSDQRHLTAGLLSLSDALHSSPPLPVLTASAMREADRESIEDLKIPGFILMECAGKAAARRAMGMLPTDRTGRVFICCGKGNNGGDGIVLARFLALFGHRVDVWLSHHPSSFGEDALAHWHLFERLLPENAGADANIRVVDSARPDGDVDLIVDALFGTGLRSSVRSPIDEVIRGLNAHPAPILALDMPSGLQADTGEGMQPCIVAAATVTMGALKAGMLLGDGPDVCGSVHVADIGIPAVVLARAAQHAGCARRSSDPWVAERIRPRTRADHKYTTGPALIAGGSEAFPGAPALAARGAARAGSGYVIALCPSEIRTILQEKLDAIPVSSWSHLDNASADELIDLLGDRWSKAKALLVGPGLGQQEDMGSFVWHLLERFDGPAVIDADGISSLALLPRIAQEFAERSKGRWILTPHDGEFRRLLHASAEAESLTEGNRIETARAFAARWNCVLLLKGLPSCCASPDGDVLVNATGNSAVGTAGTGDVLAGIETGLLAQGLSPFDAAACGIHLGGTAADDFVEEGAPQSMVAPDILDLLPTVLNRFI